MKMRLTVKRTWLCFAAFSFMLLCFHGFLVFFPSSQRSTVQRVCGKMTAKPHFIEVEKETLLYSAWFDDRKDQNYIRVLLLTSRRMYPPPLSCSFQSGSSMSVASSYYYEINWGHPKRYGLFVASCVLSKKLHSTPCFVNISLALSSEQPSSSVVLPVGNTESQQNVTDTGRREYGICVPPFHGDVSPATVIEFIEISKLLGASYFTFYDFEVSENLRKVLNYYEDKGQAQILSWKLPSYITNSADVHYYGQILAIQDCLFRSLNYFNFVAFNDLDEYIVPLQYGNMSSLLHNIHKAKHCGHCFEVAKFYRLGTELTRTSKSVTQNVFHRLRTPDLSRPTKCVVDPQRVFEHGVHIVMQPLKYKYTTNYVDWNIARMFHYRPECMCTPPCKEDLEVDKTMLKYGEQLTKNIGMITNITHSGE